MIHDYKKKVGYISFWVGNCRDFSVVDHYLSTVYLDDDVARETGQAVETVEGNVLNKLFLPANRDRACEKELKEYFGGEVFNQFEYDFGLSFD